MYKPVFLKVGDKWQDEYEELGKWGGWDSPAYHRELLAKSDSELSDYLSVNSYPGSDGRWFKSDYVRNGHVWHEKHATKFLFIIPDTLFEDLFGTKYNEYGEIAP